MKYYVQGLDCANCAAKIEKTLQKTEGLSDARLNFAAGVLYLDPQYEREAQRIIDEIEPGVRLVSAEERMKDSEAEGEETSRRKHIWRMGISILLLLIGIIFKDTLQSSFYGIPEYIIFVGAYLLVGWPVLLRAFQNIGRGQVFDENFLMTIATLGAFAIKAMPEAVGVMLFYALGEYFQDLAVDRSRRSIASLLNVRPEMARVLDEESHELIELTPEEVQLGQTIVVQPGEKIALDGIVLEGNSYIDTSMLTGESMPRYVETGTEVMAGVINGSGLLKVRVTRPFEDSSIVKIIELVENASERKAPTEHFMTSFAAWYTPLVVIGAALIAVLPPLIIPGAEFQEWIYRALILLVISCPCALVVSIPLGYFGGIGGASRQGILVKGANYLDALTDLKAIAFDKTGTLTQGAFKVEEIVTEAGQSQEELLRYAALAEMHASHPLARSIQEAYGSLLDASLLTDYQEIKGHGIEAKIEGHEVLVGNARLLSSRGISAADLSERMETVVYIAVDGQYRGAIFIADQIKEGADEAIRSLRNMGVQNNVILTGDHHAAAAKVASQVGIEEFHAELLPEDKVSRLDELKKGLSGKGKLAFVGDGMNDAPSLALSDVGIAMGALGSDAALEAADIVLMDDHPQKLVQAVEIAHYTRRIVIENVVFALGVKALVLVFGIIGLASMWAAVFADVGVALLAILNASRTLRYKAA